MSEFPPPVRSLTVVVLNYNYQDFVCQAVESALDQTVPFDQVIVVDDGSTDGSQRAIRRFGNQIQLIEKVNGGQLSASLCGLERCTSDYVLFLDADDLLARNACQEIKRGLKDSTIKLQYQLAGINADGLPVGSLFPMFAPGYDAEAMRADNLAIGYYVSPPTSGNVYRCSFLRSLNLLSLNQRDFIDGVPNLVAPYQGEVVSLAKALGSYRVHGRNHSQWSSPTTALLQGEIDWLKRRWQEARILCPKTSLPDSLANCLYVAERHWMIDCLQNNGTVGSGLTMLRCLSRARLPSWMKAAYYSFALFSVLPSAALRHRLVLAKRSPRARPKVVNLAIIGVKRIWSGSV